MATNYKKIIDPRFQKDLQFIKDNKLVDPDDWGLFKEQLRNEWKDLDENWKDLSRETEYPPLSTYEYRKRYMHSIPVRLKQKRGWDDLGSDFRIVFKVREEKKEIYYFGIGKRIKIRNPKDPHDIWSILKGRKLPEEE